MGGAALAQANRDRLEHGQIGCNGWRRRAASPPLAWRWRPALRPATKTSTVLYDRGLFGPEEYGIVSLDPANQPAMLDLDAEERAVALASLGLESRLARDERKRGVVLHQLRCPLLIVTGELEPDRQPTHYEDLDLAADYLSVGGSSHWGLVLSRRALAWSVPAVSRWMARAVNA